MAILDLPDELLGAILDLSRPYAFESLALTCKRLHSAAGDLLPYHNKLRWQYRSFSFTEDPSDVTGIHYMPQLLLEIAKEPVIASYIVHADLGIRHLLGPISRHGRGDQRSKDIIQQIYSEDGQRKLRRIVNRSSYLQAIRQDPVEWAAQISADKDEYKDKVEVDFPLAFLLTLLVNVESLVLPSRWGPSCVEPAEALGGDLDKVQRGVADLIQLLVARANNSNLKEQPLQKLRVLYRTPDVDTQYGIGMLSIAPFLALDSLREVYHESGVHESFDMSRGGWDRYPILGRNIEVMQLDDYVVDNKASQTLFKNMTKLRDFRFQYQMKDDIGDLWEAEGFVADLSAAVGGHLETLVLTQGWMYANSTPVKGFYGFNVLRNLEVDTQLFYEWVPDEPDSEKASAASRLMDMLPDSMPTLRTLRVNTPATEDDFTCLQALFQGFATGRDKQFPNLEQVSVIVDKRGPFGDILRDGWQQYAQLAKKFCEGIGGITIGGVA